MWSFLQGCGNRDGSMHSADAKALLITLCSNHTLRLQGDTRSPTSHLAWSVSADVEALTWDPSNPTHFLVSSEDGIVAAFDARSGANSAALYRLSAHDKPACCLSFNPAAKGLLATASTDKQVQSCTGMRRLKLAEIQEYEPCCPDCQ